MPSEKRLYTDDQVAEILRIASEIDDVGPADSWMKPGITEAELNRIAPEVGISRESLSKAIRQFDIEQESKQPEGLWGASPEFTLQTIVPSEIDADTWADMIDPIEATFGSDGNDKSTPGSYDWHRSGEFLSRVRARVGRGQTKIKITSNFLNVRIAVNLMLLPMASGLSYKLADALSLPAWAQMLIVIAGLSGAFLWNRSWTSRWFNKRRRRAVKLLHTLESMAFQQAETAVMAESSSVEQRLEQTT